MKFFFDNTMSKRLVDALKVLVGDEHQIVHLSERFAPSTPDTEWISRLANEGGWIVISGDTRITRNEHERQAWFESGLIAFFLAKGWASLPLWDHTWRFLKWWPEIVSVSARLRPPATFRVHVASTKLEQLRS